MLPVETVPGYALGTIVSVFDPTIFYPSLLIIFKEIGSVTLADEGVMYHRIVRLIAVPMFLLLELFD